MTKTISVKELRMNFPKVRKDLEKGVEYTIIHRSKPIAMLTPIDPDIGLPLKSLGGEIAQDKVDKKYDLPKNMEDFLKNIDKYSFKGGKPFDAVKLIRKDRGYED